MRTDLQCTRGARIVSEGDPDVRFKHGEVIIACSACDSPPPKRRTHRYQPYCCCLACYRLRETWKNGNTRHKPLHRYITHRQAQRYIQRYGGRVSTFTAPYPWRLLYNTHRDFIAYVVKT